MSTNVQHQLPPPPPAHQQQSYYQTRQPQQQPDQQQQQQYYQQTRPEQRPRATSNFSFHSRKSSGSAGGAKLAPETHEEKEQQRLHTKADPSMALNEAEPATIAAGERVSLASMRGLSFKDSEGNVISEPDRSNPTRSRWERPLDTIRSFEAAIDGNYKRQSYMRSEASDVGTNRRSSYYGGTQVSMMSERPRQYSNGYYGQGQMSRPVSYMDRQNGMGRGDSYYDSGEAGPSNGYVPNRARYPRTASEPQFNAGQGGVYPAAGAQHSYETVTTASGSGSSSDHHGYSTNPSSENSSMDKITPMRDDGNNYGFNGYGNTNSHLNPGHNQYNMSGASGVPRSSNQAPPPPPHGQNSAPPRVPMKLGKTNSNTMSEKPAPAEKRKSWFGKRFSKN